MTKDLLEAYQTKCTELKVLERNGLFPELREEILRETAEIEAFVSGLQDSRLRSIVMLRALEGLSWQEVAGRMGYSVSVSNARRIYSEGLKNILEISTL